jgi:catechol 2,3-dioxygenase-like lactoylglutathione lyase family enzyme
MPLTAIYANLACTDLDRSRAWFERLFGRAPDASPMEGLHEWHHGQGAGFQLSAEGSDGTKAGHGTLTLIVEDLHEEHRRVSALHPGSVEAGNFVSFVHLTDPDGNLVVLAEPRPA